MSRGEARAIVSAVDTETHWANGEPRLLTPETYERELAKFAASPGPIEVRTSAVAS